MTNKARWHTLCIYFPVCFDPTNNIPKFDLKVQKHTVLAPLLMADPDEGQTPPPPTTRKNQNITNHHKKTKKISHNNIGFTITVFANRTYLRELFRNDDCGLLKNSVMLTN